MTAQDTATEAMIESMKPKHDEWLDISTAPKDGTWIQAKIEGYGSDNVIVWTGGLLNDDGEDCGGWEFVGEQDPPPCWTDGICWERNEDGVSSAQPTHWKPLPEPPK